MQRAPLLLPGNPRLLNNACMRVTSREEKRIPHILQATVFEMAISGISLRLRLHSHRPP